MRKLTPGKIYRFEWNDTYSQTGWFTEQDVDGQTFSMIHESAGYLVKETTIWYIIAMHRNTTQGFKPWADISWIPKGSVRKIFSLSVLSDRQRHRSEPPS